MGLYSDDKKIPTLEEDGYNNYLNKKDVIEAHQKSFDQQVKNRHEQEDRRERLRIQRVAESGKEPLIFSLDEIISACAIADAETVTIDFSDLGFNGDMSGLDKAKNLFSAMQKSGCFDSYEPYHGSTRISFTLMNPNITKLKKYRTKLQSNFNEDGDRDTNSELHLILYSNGYLCGKDDPENKHYLFRRLNTNKRLKMLRTLIPGSQLTAEKIGNIVNSKTTTVRKELKILFGNIAEQLALDPNDIYKSDANGYRLACKIVSEEKQFTVEKP